MIQPQKIKRWSKAKFLANANGSFASSIFLVALCKKIVCCFFHSIITAGFPSSTWPDCQRQKLISVPKQTEIASSADVLLARHAFLPYVGEKRLRDEPKERLRRRLKQRLL